MLIHDWPASFHNQKGSHWGYQLTALPQIVPSHLGRPIKAYLSWVHVPPHSGRPIKAYLSWVHMEVYVVKYTFRFSFSEVDLNVFRFKNASTFKKCKKKV